MTFMHFFSFPSQKPWVYATSLRGGLRFHTFPQHLLSSKCLASGALHRLGNFLLLASFGDNCSEIYRSFQPLTSLAYAVCKRKVSWLFSRGQSLFGEISIFFPFAPFCLIYFVSSTCFENDFCSNWFQQKTRDPWHHVF